MFQSCLEVEYLDLSNFDTSNVVNMMSMFSFCFKLKKIDGIHNFNTNKIENISGMFQLCTELEYLDLSNFNISNVRNMSYMFNRCDKIKYLNLNNFITINCDTNFMFLLVNKSQCLFITNNENILKLYNSSE